MTAFTQPANDFGGISHNQSIIRDEPASINAYWLMVLPLKNEPIICEQGIYLGFNFGLN